jgi:O-antigen/teichoic acid export membrane protein
MLRFGLPYLPASISAMMLQVIDVPILRELTDYDTVGLYRANYKLGIFMMLFVSMFQYAWQPFFLTNAKETNAKEIFSKVLTLFILVSSFIWVFLSLFIEDIVKINFFGRTIIEQGYWEGLFIVPIILLAYLFYGIHVNFTAGIYIEEKTKYLPFVTGLGAAVNIVVNYVLIPVYGIMGAALATLISYFVLTIGLFFVSQKFYKINYEYSVIFRIFFACIILGSIYYYLYTNDQVNFFIKLIFLVGFLVMLYLFRVIKISELKSILNLGIRNKSE